MAVGGGRVTLIGKGDCHLCDDARAVIVAVCAETGDGWQELSIEDDPVLYDEYWERIPVVLVDGQPHDFWKVDPARLRAALAAPANR
ncbi:MAG: glutaredoxin family protein [Actinobacteria bacterium]|nr:glutaredoxin family protein [Actinomycetota bacterium]